MGPIRPRKKTKTKIHKKTVFRGRRTFQVGSVRQAFSFFLFFLGGKNDPKNTKILKKILRSIFKIFSQNFQTLVKKGLILHDYGKIKKKKKKKKSPKMEKLGGSSL